MSTTAKDNRILLIVYINIVLYATCFQLQRPLEPYLVAKLNTENSAEEYARLQSFFSFVQTIGSLITGYFLDKYSAKAGFLLTFVSSALSYYLLSISTSINILYLSKIPTVFQSGFLCAQLSVSQLTADGTDRVAALGRLTMCYTIGMVLGPALGGFLGASGDYYFGAKLSAIGSLVSVLLTCLMPTHSNNNSSSGSSSIGGSDLTGKTASTGDAVARILRVLSLVWLLLSTKVVSGVANAMAQSALPLILKDEYKFRESDMGYFMSLMSAVNAVINGAFLGPIVAYLGGNLSRVVSLALFFSAALYGVQALFVFPSVVAITDSLFGFNSGGLHAFILTNFAITVYQFILSTTLTSESTGRVLDSEKGTLLGMEHSLFAAARIVAPYTGISLLKYGGASLVSLASAAVYAGMLGTWEIYKPQLHATKIALRPPGERKER